MDSGRGLAGGAALVTVRIWNVPSSQSTDKSLKLTLRQSRRLSRDRRVHAQTQDRALDQSLREDEVCARALQVGGCAAACREGGERGEAVGLEDEDALCGG